MMNEYTNKLDIAKEKIINDVCNQLDIVKTMLKKDEVNKSCDFN